MTNKATKTTIMTSVIATIVVLGISGTSNQAFAAAYLDLTGECDQPTTTKTYGGGGICGFVGKGDVQNAFNPTWNNKQLQDRAKDVYFVYEENSTYEIVIQFLTWSPSRDDGENCTEIPNPPGNSPPYLCSTTHEVTQTKTTKIDAAVNAGPRDSPNQFTGFKLLETHTTTTGGTIPKVGDTCPNGPGEDGCSVVSVTPTGGSGTHFYAVWGSLPNTSNDISVVIV